MQPTSKPLSPFTMRLNPQEREKLAKLAKDMNMSQAAFIRAKVFDGLPFNQKKGQKQKASTLDHQTLAKLLMMLGESRIANNLNQLAKHANCGTLELDSKELEAQLNESYEAVIWMRQTLLQSLGLKS